MLIPIVSSAFLAGEWPGGGGQRSVRGKGKNKSVIGNGRGQREEYAMRLPKCPKKPSYPLFSPPLIKNDVARMEKLRRCAFFRFASCTGGAVESEHTARPRKTSLRFKIRSKNVLRAADCVYGRCDPPVKDLKP